MYIGTMKKSKKSFYGMISNTKKPNIFSPNIPSKKEQSKQYKILMERDIDKDGVPNWRDCRPFDPHRQDKGIIITDYDGILKSLLRGKKPYDLSLPEYTGLLKNAMKKVRFIETVNGYGIYAYKWSGKIRYAAMNMKSGLNDLYGRQSLKELIQEVKEGVPAELMKENPKAHTVKGTYEYMKLEGKVEEKYGGRAPRFKGRQGDKVLDIGAGSYPDLRATHAIDLVKPDKKFKDLEYKHGYNFSREKTKLPYRDNVFDVVVSYGALGRNFETQTIYNEVRRVLKPGGRLEFNADSPNTDTFLKEAGFEKPHMEYYFDESLNKKIGAIVTRKV